MAKTTHSDETKAAVMAALLAGQSISQVAREYHLPEGTVKAWRSRQHIAQTQRDALGVATDATPKKEVGDLILEYLRANLEALRAQAKVFSDPNWLKTQEAQSLAVLHGVMTDKAVRLLEAFGKSSEVMDEPRDSTSGN